MNDMQVLARIRTYHDELTAIRRDIHAHPELGMEETRTSALVAAKLREWGLTDVVEGVGRTGVVATIRGTRPASAPSACAPTWTRSPSSSRPASPMPRPRRARCTPAGMTGTPPCCSVPRATSTSTAISAAPSI